MGAICADASAEVTPAETGGTVELLTAIWRRILQVNEVTPEDNFFELGGDSLLALNLFLEIEGATGRKLPITAIYDAQTIGEQAALLADDSTQAFSPLVLLKPGDGSAPLFLFHGVGGTVVEFAALGKRIAIPGEMYAVQAQGVDGSLPPLESVEEMAELYLTAIREKQPHGPYWLCGYSFGGLLAIEVARRLQQAGEEIGLLFLIDSYAHPMTWPRISLLKVRARRAVNQFHSRLRKPWLGNLRAAFGLAGIGRAKHSRHAIDTQLPPELRKRSWLLRTKPDLPLPLLQTRLATELALSRYRPSYYDGDTLFLKARRPDPHFPTDPKRVWGKLIRCLKIQACEGSHLTLVSEHAAEVAAHINACLHESRRAAAPKNAVTEAAFRLVASAGPV